MIEGREEYFLAAELLLRDSISAWRLRDAEEFSILVVLDTLKDVDSNTGL